jgi:hypothetical protein
MGLDILLLTHEKQIIENIAANFRSRKGFSNKWVVSQGRIIFLFYAQCSIRASIFSFPAVDPIVLLISSNLKKKFGMDIEMTRSLMLQKSNRVTKNFNQITI